jgi:hypothetical protein
MGVKADVATGEGSVSRCHERVWDAAPRFVAVSLVVDVDLASRKGSVKLTKSNSRGTKDSRG